MMASNPATSSDWCQMNSTGWPSTAASAWCVSWSQLEPGNTTTPNFIAGFSLSNSTTARGSNPRFGGRNIGESGALEIRSEQRMDIAGCVEYSNNPERTCFDPIDNQVRKHKKEAVTPISKVFSRMTHPGVL